MKTTTARWIAGWAIAILFVSSTAVAQVNENLRGTIQSVDGQTLVGETRDGMTINIRLTYGAHVFTLEPESILDVKVGSFVGIMTKQAVGTDRVVEIYIFPSDPAGDPFDISNRWLGHPWQRDGSSQLHQRCDFKERWSRRSDRDTRWP